MLKPFDATAKSIVGTKQARLPSELCYDTTPTVDIPTFPSTLLVAHGATICKFVMVELRRMIFLDPSLRPAGAC